MAKTRKSLSNKADKLWKQRIHERDEVCQVCGDCPANAHHIVGRKNHQLRWDLQNGLLLCPKHHTFSSTFSAHGTPTIFAEWFKEKFPERQQHIRLYVNELWDKDYDKVFKRLGE